MYLEQLRHEQLRDVGIAVRHWNQAARLASTALGWLRQVLSLDRSDTLSRFHLHRVPGSDKLC